MTKSSDLPYCFPPHPSPRKPSYALPPGSVDTHFHIFGPPEVFPWSPPEKRVYTPPAAPLSHYHQLMEHLGISRGVVIQPMAHGHNNSVTLDAIARSNGHLLGVAKVDDTFSDRDLETLHAGGIRGVRFNMIAESGGTGNLDLIETVAGRVRDLGWSLTIHTKPDGLLENADWLARMRLPTIIDHYARVDFEDGVNQPAFQRLVDLLRDNAHIWAKISCTERCSSTGPPYADAPLFAQALVAAAPDRILWGTDWPHSQRYSIGDQCDTGELVDTIPQLVPDENDRHRILVENPLRLFDFKG
ncbi:MAG: amidohydrolase family protein [Pseudomonadota bacterium]|nr:amidohydrolase family protein [Pseudomonadota bacterium]